MNRDTIINAACQAFADCDCCALTTNVKHRMCEILNCDPWQLDEALYADDDALAIEILCG